MAKASKSKVTRISASDSKKTKKPTRVSKAKSAIKVNSSTVDNPVMGPGVGDATKKDLIRNDYQSTKNPFKAFLAYVKGAWYELQQVRWPDRANTWSMTGALLAFTAFFLLVVILLDTAFKYLFQVILGA